MSEKFTTHWVVRSSDEEGARPVWSQLDAAPASTEGLVGELTVANDDRRMLVYFADEAVRTLVTEKARDAAALVQEHEIPHQPRRPGDRPQLALARSAGTCQARAQLCAS